MVKARTLYYFRGVNSRCLCRGIPMQRKETLKGIVYDWKMKHRGLFKTFKPVMNINDIYVSKPMPLIVDDKALEGWQIVEVNLDILSYEPNVSETEPSLIAKLKHYQSEIEMWKKRVFHLEEKLITLDNKDRFEEALKKKMKEIQDNRNTVLGYSGYSGFDSPYFGGYRPPLISPQNE